MTSLAARSIFKNGAHSLGRPVVAKASARFTGSTSTRPYSTMHDNDPEVLDREKRRSLARHGYQTSSPIDHAPGWNEHLASSSEAYVKADQDLSNPAELAKRTAAHMTAKHSSEERMESSSASYDRDEVGGPLKSAAGMHGEVDEYEEELSDHDNQWHHRVVKERTVIEDVKK